MTLTESRSQITRLDTNRSDADNDGGEGKVSCSIH